VVHYRCGTCDWTSLECGLFVRLGGGGGGGSASEDEDSASPSPAREEAEPPDRLQLARAADDLVRQLSRARKERWGEDSPAGRHFREASGGWEAARRGATMSGLARAGGGPLSARPQSRAGLRVDTALDPARSIGGWSVADLEVALEEKKQRQQLERSATAEPEGIAAVPAVERLSLFDDDGAPIVASASDLGIDPSLRDLSIAAFQAQVLQNGLPSSPSALSRRDLLPLPVRLRARKTRRCRAELRDGRAGILLKPRLNPVEGDSSLRSGHGQWWKKDCSAAHVLPNVRVDRCVKVPIDPASSAGAGGGEEGAAGGRSAARSRGPTVAVVALLRVSNPTLGPLRVRFAPSPYRGELDWDAAAALGPAAAVEEDEEGDGRRYTDVLPGLLVHSFTQSRWDVEYDSGVLRHLAESETVELHSPEDAILELGSHRAREIPAGAASWRPPSGVASPALGALPRVRLVTRGPSSAWFELAFVEPERFLDTPPPSPPASPSSDDRLPEEDDGGSNARNRSAYAVSLRLEVEVGAGTWESSLIQPRASQDEGFVDRVPFDLVLAYQ
jgi:hypothetical protein